MAKKKLDNGNLEAQEPADEIVEDGMLLDEDIESDVDEFDTDNEDLFSDIFADDDEDEEDSDSPEEEEEDADEEEPDEEPDDEEDESEEPPEPPKKKHKKTPAEIKLVNLIKENKRLQKEKQEIERKAQEKQQEQQTESLTAEYLSQGYDEDTAKKMARDDLRFNQLEERQAVLDFREENADVFSVYPEARTNAADIMRRANAANLTAEQICFALYGEPVNAKDQRAIQSAQGLPARKVDSTSKLSRASRQATIDSSESLSVRDKKFKRYLEKNFNDGKEMTVKEFLKYKK